MAKIKTNVAFKVLLKSTKIKMEWEAAVTCRQNLEQLRQQRTKNPNSDRENLPSNPIQYRNCSGKKKKVAARQTTIHQTWKKDRIVANSDQNESGASSSRVPTEEEGGRNEGSWFIVDGFIRTQSWKGSKLWQPLPWIWENNISSKAINIYFLKKKGLWPSIF